jgi:CBS domain-containing protein
LPVRKITLFLLGGMARLEKESPDAKTEFWMSIAGPATSVAIGFAFLLAARLAGWQWFTIPRTPGIAVLSWLGYINLMLAIFNMTPGFPLDGGRVLRAAIWWITGDAKRATRIAAKTGQLVAISFIAFGIFQVLVAGNFGGLWIALIGWFLFQSAGAALLQQQMNESLRGLRVSDVMSRDYATADADLGLAQFIEEDLLRTGRRCFLVTSGGLVRGLITPQEIKKVNRSRWSELSVRDVMRGINEVHAVSPDTPLSEAVDLLAREDVNQLPVTAGANVVGLLTRSHILQLLQSRAELAPAHSA